MQEDKFSMFIPFEIEKGGDANDDSRYDNMKVKGVFSSSRFGEDADGETIDPSGMDFSELLTRGNFNWHHQQSSDPLAIVGEPTKVEINADGDAYVEGKLYKDSKKAREIYDLAQILEKNSDTRRLGYSLEGKALVRDKKNPKKILKSRISGIAITYAPKNKGTKLELMKGSVSDWGYEDSNGGNFESTEYVVDVIGEDGIRRTVDKNFNIKVWPIEKSITTSTIAPGTPESVEHDKKKVRVPQDNWPAHNKDNNLMKNSLTKANLYVQFLQEGYSKEDCKHLVKLVDAIEKGEIEYDLEKGGEGSKGGKVIGHTQSGKPIYASYHESYNHFTPQEHKEAQQVHSQAISKIPKNQLYNYSSGRSVPSKKHKQHLSQINYHSDHSRSGEEKQPEQTHYGSIKHLVENKHKELLSPGIS